MKLLGLLLSLTVVACARPSTSTPTAEPTPTVRPTAERLVAGSADQEATVPIASYPNPAVFSDEVEVKLQKLLGAREIPWSAGGSIGFTLHVPASRAAEARALLRSDPALMKQVTVYDEARP